MTSANINSPPERPESDLSAATIFSLLADERRLYTLHYLLETGEPVALRDLADQLARWETGDEDDPYGRIAISLIHTHVPTLVDAGVVEYDPDANRLELREPAAQLVPYLELADLPAVE